MAIDINKEQEAIKAGVVKENLTFSKQNSLQDSSESSNVSSKSCSSSSLSGPTSRISSGTAPSLGQSQNDVPTATLVSPNSCPISKDNSCNASPTNSLPNISLANSDTHPDMIEVDSTENVC